jgi:hypothetical protein
LFCAFEIIYTLEFIEKTATERQRKRFLNLNDIGRERNGTFNRKARGRGGPVTPGGGQTP